MALAAEGVNLVMKANLLDKLATNDLAQEIQFWLVHKYML